MYKINKFQDTDLTLVINHLSLNFANLLMLKFVDVNKSMNQSVK